MNKENKIAILSLSGGMDSTSLLIRLLAERYRYIFCISFYYKQKHSIELERAVDNIKYLKQMGFSNITHIIIDLSSVMGMFNSSLIGGDSKDIPEGHYAQENMKSTVVPNRNAIFASIIFGLALSKTNEEGFVDICLGTHSGDHHIYPDCTPQFQDALEHAFKIGNYDSHLVNYYTPFIQGNKTTILQDCLKNCELLNLDFDEVLRNTITSYSPDTFGRSSGKTGSDIERVEAFINISRRDPIQYQEPWEDVVQHVKSVLQDAK